MLQSSIAIDSLPSDLSGPEVVAISWNLATGEGKAAVEKQLHLVFALLSRVKHRAGRGERINTLEKRLESLNIHSRAAAHLAGQR